MFKMGRNLKLEVERLRGYNGSEGYLGT